MHMKNPAHPGEILREIVLPELNLTITAAAQALSVSRLTLFNVIHAKNGVSPDMAIRLEQVFGSTAETWLRMQLQYDLAKAMQRNAGLQLMRYAPLLVQAGKPG
jgi:antitoxin HigA-1